MKMEGKKGLSGAGNVYLPEMFPSCFALCATMTITVWT